MTHKAQIRRASFDWPQIEFEAMQSFHVKQPTSVTTRYWLSLVVGTNGLGSQFALVLDGIGHTTKLIKLEERNHHMAWIKFQELVLRLAADKFIVPPWHPILHEFDVKRP